MQPQAEGRNGVGSGSGGLFRLQEQGGSRSSKGCCWISLLRVQSGAGPKGPLTLLGREVVQARAEVLGLVLADIPPESPAVRRPSFSLLISVTQPGQGQTSMIRAQEEARRPREARDEALSQPGLPLSHHCSPCFIPNLQPRRTSSSLPAHSSWPRPQRGHGARRDNLSHPLAKGEIANTGDFLLDHCCE